MHCVTWFRDARWRGTLDEHGFLAEGVGRRRRGSCQEASQELHHVLVQAQAQRLDRDAQPLLDPAVRTWQASADRCCCTAWHTWRPCQGSCRAWLLSLQLQQGCTSCLRLAVAAQLCLGRGLHACRSDCTACPVKMCLTPRASLLLVPRSAHLPGLSPPSRPLCGVCAQ